MRLTELRGAKLTEWILRQLKDRKTAKTIFKKVGVIPPAELKASWEAAVKEYNEVFIPAHNAEVRKRNEEKIRKRADFAARVPVGLKELTRQKGFEISYNDILGDGHFVIGARIDSKRLLLVYSGNDFAVALESLGTEQSAATMLERYNQSILNEKAKIDEIYDRLKEGQTVEVGGFDLSMTL